MTLPLETSSHPHYSNTYATRGAHIFRPPSAASPTFTSSNDYFSPRSRKRQRPDSSHSQPNDDTPQQETWRTSAGETPSWYQCPTPRDPMYMSSGAAVNERYRLAGGFDTPGLLATSENDQYDDRDFRRCVRDLELPRREESNTSTISGPLARERNGVARMASSPDGGQAHQGWTSFAFGLVGKVFTFGTSVIKGFYAGGGKGFDLRHQDHSMSDSWMQSSAVQEVGTPVPGAWSNDEFLGNFEQDNFHSPSLAVQPVAKRPPNKRRQTDRDSWVMVGTPEAQIDLSPKRKVLSTNVPRASLGARPSASKANSRRSLAPLPRRQSSSVSHAGSPAQHLQMQQHDSQPSHHNKRASIAPTRLSTSRPSSSHDQQLDQSGATYITPESERILKRQARQEKAAEKAMSSMSKQLEDLIRQGREALGTKVSVEGSTGHDSGMDMDEEFVDEEW